ncbi:hypothetical protein [Lactiplantibacillus plantarum]|uniref:hypothetical protein n=1 Tax=Lactiplantibacillus plantarum TaxID=1590 RepID=UPI001EE95CCC|nr:hypothetical protein [Lactiplantibacillus plantarum]
MPVVISSLIPVVAPVKRQVINVTTLANTVHLYGLLGFKQQIIPATDQIVAPFAGVITAVAANRRPRYGVCLDVTLRRSPLNGQ